MRKANENKSKPVAERAPIPVGLLTLEDNHDIDIPGRGAYASQQVFKADDRVTIEYMPWMRHHRISCGDKVVMVPEAWCSWEPL